ncbi:MAG TPA: hypothetical protein VNX47_05610 [Nevskia sp.]|nr:hypothetical protein [Nevskia sp.]
MTDLNNREKRKPDSWKERRWTLLGLTLTTTAIFWVRFHQGNLTEAQMKAANLALSLVGFALLAVYVIQRRRR